MADLLHLAEALSPPSDVLELIADLLEAAKAGEVRALAIAYESTGQTTTTAYAVGDGDRAHLHFALSTVKARIMQEVLDDGG